MILHPAPEIINGQRIIYIDDDGNKVSNPVSQIGETEDGELCFYELCGYSNDAPKGLFIDDKEVYKRLLIRRVFPAIVQVDNGNYQD